MRSLTCLFSDAIFLYSGAEVCDGADKSRRLKQMVVDQAPDLHTLKAVTLKNW